jgi:hypothetical protein
MLLSGNNDGEVYILTYHHESWGNSYSLHKTKESAIYAVMQSLIDMNSESECMWARKLLEEENMWMRDEDHDEYYEISWAHIENVTTTHRKEA